MSLCKKLFQLLRVSDWSKSIFVFLGVIYTNTSGYWGRAFFAALAFCLTASAVYIYNDLQDMDEDKAHPQKSHRPLASGEVSIVFALITLFIVLSAGLILGFAISAKLAMILSTYLLINFFYNQWIRRLPVLDVLCIACGFMLRVLAGTLGIGLPMAWWLLITATLLSLFIALCKRRLEMQLGLKRSNRAVLRKYNTYVLDILIAVTASSCFIAYLFYTLTMRAGSYYFILTLPFCALGLWRFTYLTTKRSNNDDPMTVFIHDKVSLLNLLCFAFLTIMELLR